MIGIVVTLDFSTPEASSGGDDSPVVDHDAEFPGPAGQCQVLRCQSDGTRVFLVEQSRWGLFETLVCGTHCAALRSGAAFAYNSAENVIYMGVDVAIAS
jgi:hypothetical protein